MVFTKITWVDKSNPSFNPLAHPKLNAENLNRYESAIETLNNEKVDKVAGKGLSTNDYTNDEKGKVESLSSNMVYASIDKTVGSGKDFATLDEALTWVSGVGSIGAGVINLILDEGTYQIGKDTVDIQLDDALPSMYQIQNIRLNIKSASNNKANCTVSLRADLAVPQSVSVLQMVRSVCTFTDVTLNQSILGYNDVSKYIDFISGHASSLRFNFCDVKNVTHMSFYDSVVVAEDTIINTIDKINMTNSSYMNVGLNSEILNAVNGFILKDMSRASIKGVNIVDSTIANIPLNQMQEDGSYIIDGTVKLAQPYSGDILTASSIVDSLTSNATNMALSANQGSVLKTLIDSINGILTTDDASLDELQEIVNFLKLNKSSFDLLQIENVIGLIDALEAKLDVTVPVVATGLTAYQPDLLTDNYFEYIIDRDSELENPRHMLQGRTGKIVLKQDVIGGWAMTFGSYYHFPSGDPVVNMTPNANNVFNYTVLSDSCILLEYASDFVPNGIILDQALTFNNLNIETEFIA